MFKKYIIKSIYYIIKKKSLIFKKKYLRYDKLSKEEIEKLQIKLLNKLIQFTYKENKFYRELWKKNNINLEINSIEDIEKFPIVTKEMLRKAKKEGKLISKPFLNKRSNHIDRTTGSSGEPFEVILNKECIDERVGSSLAIQEWYNLFIGDTYIKLWRGPLHKNFKKKIFEWLTGKITLSIYDPQNPVDSGLDSKRIQKILSEINKIKPKGLDGFVSALTEISDFMLKNKIKLSFELKFITTGAERLNLDQRKKIEEAFQCTVFNRYGGTEFSIIAHECKEQTSNNHFLHTIDYRGIIETVENNQPIFEKEGNIIFTDFFSLALPLIRYKTGDRGILSTKKECNCNKPYKILKDVTGRINDMFELPNGKKISSHIWHHYFKKCLGIKQYQIIQEKINQFKVRINLHKEYNKEQLDQLKSNVENTCEDATVYWEETDFISKGKGGKIQQCISLVKPDEKD